MGGATAPLGPAAAHAPRRSQHTSRGPHFAPVGNVADKENAPLRATATAKAPRPAPAPAAPQAPAAAVPRQFEDSSRRSTASIDSVNRLFSELTNERAFLLREGERLFNQRLAIGAELRNVERLLCEYTHRKMDLEAQLGKLGAREQDIRSMVEGLDGKLSCMGEEAVRFERQLRGIRGTDSLNQPSRLYHYTPTNAEAPVATLYGHTAPVTCVSFDERAGLVVSGSADRTLRVWDLKSGQCRRTLVGHSGWVRTLGYHGGELISGGADGLIRTWETASGRCLGTLTGHRGAVACLQFDASVLVSGGVDRTVRVWDRTRGVCTSVLQGHKAYVADLKFWQYGLATASGDGTIRMWDLRSGECHRTLSGHTAGVTCLQFDDRNLYSAGWTTRCASGICAPAPRCRRSRSTPTSTTSPLIAIASLLRPPISLSSCTIRPRWPSSACWPGTPAWSGRCMPPRRRWPRRRTTILSSSGPSRFSSAPTFSNTNFTNA